MSVQLTPDAEAIVRRKVESGLYSTAEEAIAEALRLLEEHDCLRWLREAVAKGEQGEGLPFSPELRAELWENAIRRWKSGDTPRPDVLPPDANP